MLKPGDSFERYTIEALLGQGGMGAVYRAHDPRLGRRVALKVLADGGDGAEARARLLREARAAAALDHPNAVAIFDVGEHEGQPYIVMELVEGRTLRALVGDATVPPATRLTHLVDAARALAGAHRRGLVHRDVKPENVMVRDDGAVKVLDFGIARSARRTGDPAVSTTAPALATLTLDGARLGTPVYMAPEQIRGDALDGRADQFAWGVLAYELLAGRLPWRGAGDALAVMASILTDPVEGAPLLASGVPEAVAAVILRALEKRPEARFASMDELLLALEAAGREPAPAPGVTAAQQFSTADVRAVLAQAVERQAQKQGTRLSFAELLAVAAEVGVDDESLREASRALRVRPEAPPATAPAAAPLAAAERDAWIRRQRRLFHRHAGVYGIVNAALLVLGLVLLSFTPWWVWFIPGLLWAIGLAIHGMMALSADEDDWREETENIALWREGRRRRHEVALARAAGTPRLPDAAPRPRIEATPPRVRVADSGGEQAQAEAGDEEEEVEDARPGARRRR
jgi:serine/threonine-protein kinase